MEDNNNLKELEGVVDSILYSNPENGYIVLELDMGGDYVTVTGELGNIEEGEELVVTGDYVKHPKFGMQFRAGFCRRKMPATSNAILKYLSSGVLKGVGPTLAKRLVDEFGEKTLEIIENEPELLVKVKGITPKKVDEISMEFKRIFGIRTLMIFLSQYGIQPSAAVGAWRRWGQYAVEVIKENPYVLCGNGIELEFGKAEEMAEKIGYPMESGGRISAGIIHILVNNTFSGHTCLPYDRLKETALKLLNVDEKLFDECLENECKEENLVRYEKGSRSFIYLADYHKAEEYITARLNVMSSCLKDTKYDYAKLIAIEESAKDITYAEQQRKAISLALSQGFMILTGGPGTGKTTTLKAIISLYEQRGLKVMLAAPTGKAAKRISDLTGYDAKTIHRMLEVVFDNSGKTRFKHDENNPISCDVMIVDEMSMVDTLLFEALLRALRLSCRLIMVGDSDQLPSVGAGNVLKDMIDSGRLPVVQLTEIFRQARQSSIVMNAHRIVGGEQPDLSRTDSDFFFMQRLNFESASETVVELVSKRLPKAYKFDPKEDIQVLCPSRKGALGVVEMNKTLQNAVNPAKKDKPEIKGVLYTFRADDKVMQVKNNYDISWKKGEESGAGIFNGDIGTILKVVKAESKIFIDFDGRIAEYGYEMLDQLELAYAVSVHKSQGSEFNAVIIPLLGGFDKLYYRNLLYTAVTRAKKILIIVGSARAVEKMVENNRRTLRYTCLKDMLEKELKEYDSGG
ncbi:MAG: ATP-dependent RecD-like DNA helicase [Ruminococcus sp.]|nr:ATP-dependent RecD-like DNA helicase [Ruminococcus sp.]MCM1382240.1 ATP-dependent RecD-like DNA helicase [Muribaculaceae bacterium]MCM1478154.1 ATP-dependent RecD-like DNA helicase [Muribaculaceae bacterium]